MRIVTLLCALAFLATIVGLEVFVVCAAAGAVLGVVWPNAFEWPRKPPPKPVDPDALRDDPVF